MMSHPKDIKDLESRINKIKSKDVDSNNPTSGVSSSARKGLHIVIEFVSGVFVGGAIGYFLDYLLKTKPLLLIIMLFFGAFAGFLNVYRFVKDGEK